MGIVLGSNFTVEAALPLDDRQTVADLTARDAINALRRYVGMIVYVESEETNYQLIGGVDNADWRELSGSGGGGVKVVTSKTERDAIIEDERYPGLLVFINDGDFQIQTTYQLVGGITNAHWQIVGGGNNSTMTLSGFGGPVYETNHNVLMSPESDNTGAVIEAGMPIGKELSFLRIYESSFTCTISLSGSETFLNGDTSYTLPGSGDYLKMKKITSTLWGKFS